MRLILALALAAAGLLAIVSALTPNVPWRDEFLRQLEPDPALALGHVLTCAAGALLLGLALGVARGQRRAAHAAIVVLLIVAVLDAVKGLDYEESLLALSLAWMLRVSRNDFRRGTDVRRGVVAGTIAIGAVAGAYAISTLDQFVTGRSAGIEQTLEQAFRDLITGRWWLTSSEPTAIALDLLVGLALVAGAVFLHQLLSPARTVDGHSEDDHRVAARLVAAHGADSLAPFALREDKAFFFAAGGLLAYRVLHGTAVVSGDPVAPPGGAPDVLAQFAEYATSKGWSVVVTGAAADQLDAYRELGFRALHIGNEAVVDPRGFTLEGRWIRKVRQSLHRAERQGWQIEVLSGEELGPQLAAGLEQVESRWREAQKRLQGFAMTLGHLWRAEEARSDLYAVATSPAGEVCGFLRFVAYRGGLSLDVMRRLEETPNGLVEAMVARALLHASERGIKEVSLNFAGFAHLMAADAALTNSQKLLRWLLARMHGRFQLERLVQFNEKFRPEWRPRYLVYAGRTALPIAGLRVLQAEAYIPAPRQRPLKLRWRPPASGGEERGATGARAQPSGG